MPLTNAEKQKRWREKQKALNPDQYKKKHNIEQKLSRIKNKCIENSLPTVEKKKIEAERKKNIRERVRKCREKKISVKVNEENTPYANKAAFSKAISRAKKSLPSTPRRRKVVLSKLAVEESLIHPRQLFVKEISTETDSSNVIKKTIEEFYERDDVSRVAPGKKDVVIFRINGEKFSKQKRHLFTSLKEAHAMFKKNYPNIPVGKSKFAQLRPNHVLLNSKLPHNICMCKYHENFIIAVNTLNKAVQTFPSYTHDFPNSLICESPTENCWFQKCDNCCYEKTFIDKSKYETDDGFISWYVWKERKEGIERRIEKVVEEGTIQDLRDHICSQLPSFMEHCYVKRNQAESYNSAKVKALSDNFDQTRALIQIDFSENYKCISQDEIQSAHWNQNQVSLFTSALWFDGTIHPVILVSKELTHTKDTVIAYIDILLEKVPDNIHFVDMWSDGPSSQFKNHYVMSALDALQKKHNLTITWNFFASSHGKGPVDGIGGTAKRVVWNKVKNREYIVNNAADFAKVANTSTEMEVTNIEPEIIQKRNISLNLDSIINHSVPIKGISKMHYFEVTHGKPTGLMLTNSKLVSKERDDFVPGEWVLVDYESKYYPGEVIRKVEGSYCINTMIPAGNHWKWPNKPDQILYKKEKVVKKISFPTLVNNRNQFSFNELF